MSAAETAGATLVWDWVEARRGAMLDDLVAYASLETPSDDEALLAAGLTWIEAWLGRVVGPAAARAEHPTPGYGVHVALDYPSATADPDAPWITALCHYDTVWSAGTIGEWPVTVDGDRITGPGVFDMKAGLVQFAYALAAVDTLGLPRPGIRLLLNADEEVGSKGSRPVIEDTVTRSGGPVLVFESAAAGAVKTARKGVGLFDIAVAGVAVHAGLEPTAGASAIDEAARVVLALHAATDIAAGTSLNVGVLHGGTRPNVKAASAALALDVRVSSAAEAARIDQVLADLRAANPLASITVTGGWNRPVMERTDATAALFATASGVAASMGVALREVSVGGASDGNFASALGFAVLDGIGAVGDGAHARHEWTSIDGMVERSTLAALLFAELGAPAAG